MLHHYGVFGALVLTQRHDMGRLVEERMEGISDLGDDTADLLALLRDFLDFLEENSRLYDEHKTTCGDLTVDGLIGFCSAMLTLNWVISKSSLDVGLFSRPALLLHGCSLSKPPLELPPPSQLNLLVWGDNYTPTSIVLGLADDIE